MWHVNNEAYMYYQNVMVQNKRSEEHGISVENSLLNVTTTQMTRVFQSYHTNNVRKTHMENTDYIFSDWWRCSERRTQNLETDIFDL